MLKAYGALLVEYCLAVGPGHRVLIRTGPAGLDLAEEVAIGCWERGAIPHVMVGLERSQRQLIEGGTATQWAGYYDWHTVPLQTWERVLSIQAPLNTHAMTGIAPSQITAFQSADPAKQVMMTRAAAGALQWTSCLRPCAALAQDAKMDTHQYEQLVWGACGLTQADPIAFWTAQRAMQATVIERLKGADRIRYVGIDTDVTFSTKGRVWINSDGRRNMPSGEVFTAPIETSVNGVAYFDVPIRYGGDYLEGVRLEWQDGTIVRWSATRGEAALTALMAVPGARMMGEVAIGLNEMVRRPTGTILLDEKMAGSIHMAIGASYPETGGRNESAIHLDLIKTMTEGCIEVDGQCIYRNGVFC